MELTQGPVTGELPPALLPIEEHGMKLLVDIQGGHKTGYYLDQRDSRLVRVSTLPTNACSTASLTPAALRYRL